MKEMTPMKRYKTSIDMLRSNLKYLTNEISLNKAESRSIPWPFQRGDKSSTKGVENDFVLIFQDRMKQDLSFAFTFDYIGKEDKDQTVFASIKYGEGKDELKVGSIMNLLEFKSNLNEFNKKLENKGDLSFDKIIEEFNSQFIKNEFNLSNEIKSASKNVSDFLKNKTKELGLDKINNLVEQATEIRMKAEKSVDEKIKASSEYKEKEKLLARLSALNESLETKKILFEKKENLAEKKQAERDAIRMKEKGEITLADDLNKELIKYPKAVKNRIRT